MSNYTPAYPHKYGKDVSAHRDAILQRDGIDHYATIGYFLQWFAAVEIHLDRILSWASEQTDYVSYSDLVRGMAPRVKLERLRAICKRKAISFGPLLKDRIKHFEEVVLPIRNRLAHCFVLHDKTTDLIGLLSLKDITASPTGGATPTHSIHTLHLYEVGVFLNLLSSDLKVVTPPVQRTRGVTLELDAPRSRLPSANQKDHPPQVTDASVGKPPPEE